MNAPECEEYDAVDPQLRPLLDVLPKLRLDPEGIAATRAKFAELAALALSEPVAAGVIRTEYWSDGPVPVRMLIYRPEATAPGAPAILHAHSGGYVIGSPEARDAANRHWAAALGAVIVSVDYRLSPEAPYPAALDDAYCALAWLVASSERLGIDPGRILLMGESAGGGLCAALALLARDRGEYEIAGQLLVYPMLDDRTGRDTVGPQGHLVWTRSDNECAWEYYLGGAAPTGFAAPARARDLGGLPPAALFVGDLDLFLAEDLSYAERLSRAGVSVEIHVYPGAFHAFDAWTSADVSHQFRQDVERSARRMIRAR